MASGKTAILIPSLGRPQHVARVVGNIEQNTPEPHTQIWCMTGDDYKTALDELGLAGIGTMSHHPKGYYLSDADDADRRYVTRMNKMVSRLMEVQGVVVAGQPVGYDYVFFGSDDVVHHPFWLANAIKVMETAPNAQVVVVNDLRNPSGTQALVRMDYLPLAVFDDPASAFHKGYQHNFADTEMFRTAAKRGVIYRAMDSHVEHLHPLHAGSAQRPWDSTYENAQKHWHEDAALFEARMKLMEEAL